MWFRSSKVGARLLAVLVLAACTKPSVVNDGCAGSYVLLDESYLLGPGDVLIIVVFNHEDLSGEFFVSEAGTISLPSIGEIRVEQRTISEVEQDYSDFLSNRFSVKPSVSVNAIQYRPYFIIGGVQEPGAYPYQPAVSIEHAIAVAGGYSEPAIRDTPPVLKCAGGAQVRDEITVRTPVCPGDVIDIPVRATAADRG